MKNHTTPEKLATNPEHSDLQADTYNPGQAAGIISLLLGFVGLAPFGLVLSIISTVQSRRAGMTTVLGIMGVVINMVALLTVTFLILVFALSR